MSTVYCLLSTTGVVHRLQAGLSLGGAHAREVCGNVQSGEEKYVNKNQKNRICRCSREATRSSSAGTPSELLIRTEAAPSTSQSSYWPCTSRPLVSRHATSSHVMSRHATPRHATSRHVTSFHVTSCHVMSHHATLRHVTSRHARHATSRHVTSCHITTPHHVTPTSRHVTSLHITLKLCLIY